MPDSRIFVSGSLAYDRIMDFEGKFVDHFNPKKLHAINLSFAAKTVEMSYGGTAGNISYSLALLGMPVEVVGSLGQDGQDYLRRLKKFKIGTRYIRVHPKALTAGAYILTDSQDNQISAFAFGAMSQPCVLPKSGHREWGIISPDVPRNMASLSRHYRKNKTPYIYDPGQALTALSPSQLKTGMASARVIIGNDYETDLMFKRANYGLSSKQVLVTTFGAKGSQIKCGNRIYKIPAVKAKQVIDPTGAGDAYRAGLITGILRGCDWPASGRLAATIASYAVEKQGTQAHKFSWKDVRARYYKNFHIYLD